MAAAIAPITSPPSIKIAAPADLDKLISEKSEKIAELKALAIKEIEDFHTVLKDDDEELILLRCLLEFQSDISQALPILKKSIEYRRGVEFPEIKSDSAKDEFKLDLASLKFADKMAKFGYPRKLFCFLHAEEDMKSKESSNPISFEIVGKWDAEKYTANVTIEEHCLHLRQELILQGRLLNKLSRVRGTLVKLDEVIDLMGLGLKHMKLRKYSALQSDISLALCPETLGHVYVVNAPSVFNMIWKVAKPLLSEHTISKVSLCDKKHTYDHLTKSLRTEKFPEELFLLHKSSEEHHEEHVTEEHFEKAIASPTH